MVSQCSSLWLDEETTRTQAEKPLVRGQEGCRKREGESSDVAQAITNAIAVWRAAFYDRIFDQQPPQTPFNAQRIFISRVLTRGTLSPIVAPPTEEARHVGQCRIENWLNLKAHDFLGATRRE
jgi:hypothetical protein